MLAAKGGLDVDETRRLYPRVAEVPFDSDYKFMATFHEMEATGGRSSAASSRARRTSCSRAPRRLGTSTARTCPIDGDRERVLGENDRLAGEGLRVLAVASRDFDPATFDPDGPARRGPGPDAARPGRDRRPAAQGGEGRHRALQGRRDPRAHDHGRPRDDRRGDRAQLGIEGRALTGTEFAALSDAELERAGRRDRRRRARRARGQGAARRGAQAEGQRRRDDRRRRQRRAGAQARRHRRRDGDHRHRGDEGSRRT